MFIIIIFLLLQVLQPLIDRGANVNATNNNMYVYAYVHAYLRASVFFFLMLLFFVVFLCCEILPL